MMNLLIIFFVYPPTCESSTNTEKHGVEGHNNACREPYCGALQRFSASTDKVSAKEKEGRQSARIMVVTFNTGGVAHFAMTEDTASGFRAAAELHRVSLVVVALQNAALSARDR